MIYNIQFNTAQTIFFFYLVVLFYFAVCYTFNITLRKAYANKGKNKERRLLRPPIPDTQAVRGGTLLADCQALRGSVES